MPRCAASSSALITLRSVSRYISSRTLFCAPAIALVITRSPSFGSTKTCTPCTPEPIVPKLPLDDVSVVPVVPEPDPPNVTFVLHPARRSTSINDHTKDSLPAVDFDNCIFLSSFNVSIVYWNRSHHKYTKLWRKKESSFLRT